ncbi:MAG: acylase [Bacteroidia bacterium]|nr:MAG: acylase [Bacteroidia bacterium]
MKHMNPNIKITGLLVIALSFTVLPAKAQRGGAEILWDHYGVPHIYGESTEAMYYANGWAQMHNHANLLLKLYAQARGCAAEYFGDEYLVSDKKIMLFKVPEQALKVVQQQSPEFKTYLEAFVKGLNDFATKHPGEISDDVEQVLPVTLQDVMGHVLRITSLEFLAAEDIYISGAAAQAGSNSIAIAPSRSATDHAMLVINPHLPWSGFFTLFEAHLTTEGFSAYGVSLVGIPSLIMAFNENLGWAHTINPIDASDRYELTLQGDGYLLDGKVVLFEKKKVTLKVKQKDGSMLEEEAELIYSRQGPVVGQNETKAYAVRIAGFENPRVFEQYHRMAQAGNLAEFEDALKMMQSSMFNVIYADKAGNILYLFNGNIPKRKEGDFAFWKGTIDGTNSKYIWNRTHPYKDLPRLLNPPSGFIQNCNDPPWTSTLPTELDPLDYPAYMSSLWTPLRPQRAINMIKNNPAISYDQLMDMKHNTGMEAADRFLDDLLAANEEYPDSTVMKASMVLREWDQKTEAGSKGAVLFAAWWDKVRNDLFEIPWNATEPATTPDGIKNQKLAVEMLVEAANEVQQKYGALDVAWGAIYRYRLNGYDYPANGGPGEYGIFRTIYYTDVSEHKKVAIAGETFVAVTEFGEKVRAMVLLSYGNSTQPGSKHAGDQLKMLSEKILRPALLDKSDISNNTEERELLQIK